MNGPWIDLFVDSLEGTSGDDMMAFNSAEGNLYTTITAGTGPQVFGGLSTVYYGNGLRTIVRNIRPHLCLDALRFTAGADPRNSVANILDQVLVDGINGTVVETIVPASTVVTSFPGLKARLVVRNINVQVVSPTVTDPGFILGGNITDIKFEGISFTDLRNGPQQQFFFEPDTVIGRLEISGLVIREDSSEAVSQVPIPVTQGTIDELVIHDCNWSRNAVTAESLVAISGGTVNRVEISDTSISNVNNLLSITGGTVGGVTTSGICHRGANSNPTINIGTGVTLPRLRSCGSDTAQLQAGAGTVTSKKTDGTEDS